jgi:hypothetical protein
MVVDGRTFDWRLLHDGILKSIVLEWSTGIVEVQLVLSGEAPNALIIRAEGLRRFDCPREQPWGESIHVNSAELACDLPSVELRLEMQSGDVVRVCADAIYVDRG